MPVYLFEPSLLHDEHYDDRHWRFVWESLEQMQKELKPYGVNILIAWEEADSFFRKAAQYYDIQTVFSHEETGIYLTYQRDIKIAGLFRELGIDWHESPTNERGLMHRNGWRKKWNRIMHSPIAEPDLNQSNRFLIWIHF